MFDNALALFALEECESLLIESSCLYDSNRRDTWELLCQSLENQTFSSVINFHDFYDRLERSIQHISVEMNYIKFHILKMSFDDLIKFLSSDRTAKSLKIMLYSNNNFVDNRDLGIFDTIDASGNVKKLLDKLNQFKVFMFII